MYFVVFNPFATGAVLASGSIVNYNIALEIKRLENLIMNEVDPIEQAKISNQIMKLKIGSEEND